MSDTPSNDPGAVTLVPETMPQTGLSGLRENFAKDALAGFLVFLIALPLCLGIALASGFPPVAGVFTAVLGGLIAPFISNSELTIKGPAAGLIVIVLGAITDFGGSGFSDGVWSAADQNAYRLTLGVGVVAALAQILFGVAKGGILGEFFPSSAVHGLLAAIGVIIMAKQIPVALGVTVKGDPIHLLLTLPSTIVKANPEIALIGGVSLAILIGWTFVKHPIAKRVPGQVLVLLVSVPLAYYLGLDDPAPHKYEAFGHTYEVSQKYLVNVPMNFFSGMVTPDFSGVATKTGIYWAVLFMLIGTLESLLSAKAVEILDPWRRKTNLDSDNTAVGVGNLVASAAGGLPMISEIVRSRASVDAGARTRFANMFHGIFLLSFMALVPGLIRMIPLAALAAMLVFTGFRLAHPREFAHVKKIGTEQLVVFAGTTIAVLMTDLLEGIAIGVGIEIIMLLALGIPLSSVFKLHHKAEESDDTVVLKVEKAAVFSNWLSLKKRIESIAAPNVVVDLRSSSLVDHTVMDKLHAMQREFEKREQNLTVLGLDDLEPVSNHPLAARRATRRPAA